MGKSIKMKKDFKRITAAISLILSALLIFGCGNDKGMELRQEQLDAAEKIKNEEGAPEKAGDEDEAEAKELEGDKDSDKPSKGESLAKRMCGKYSYHAPGGEDEDEYYIIEMISFGDNLYAFCGEAMADEGYEELESYSFWASEFLPDDADDLRSDENDRVNVNVASFSVMSNLGKYFGPPIAGSVELTDDGILFDRFDDGFFCPEGDSRLFLKDERVEDTFPYLVPEEKAKEGPLDGVWETEDGAGELFFMFEDGNLYMYRKAPDDMVYLAAGGFYIKDEKDGGAKGSFEYKYSILGCGSEPYLWNGDYSIENDVLTLTGEDDSVPEGRVFSESDLTGSISFKRGYESDIPVFSTGDVKFDENDWKLFAEDPEFQDVPSDDEGFFGIWVSASTDREEAVKDAKKLNDLGYDSYVAYSNEWENLTNDGYFCVSACRVNDEDKAGAMLADVQMDGYRGAYVKHSGKHLYSTVSYTNYGDMNIKVSGDKVILSNVTVSFPYVWYPGFDEAENEYEMTLVLDKDTVFDKTCDLQCFANHKKGDKPVDWFIRNYELMKNDTDKYMENGPALSGVFEVGINGSHIDRFLGSYWWD